MGTRKADAEDTGFGARLKELREAAGLSQSALAEAAGLNQFGVAKLEQGVREPKWSTVLAMAAALGITPNDFRPVEPAKRGKR